MTQGDDQGAASVDMTDLLKSGDQIRFLDSSEEVDVRFPTPLHINSFFDVYNMQSAGVQAVDIPSLHLSGPAWLAVICALSFCTLVSMSISNH